jgi:hypothetical protein
VVALSAAASCSSIQGSEASQSCDGLPRSKCVAMVEQAEADAPAGSGGVAGMWIRCTTVCTEEAGEADYEIAYVNGLRNSGHEGWRTAGPAPGAGRPPRGAVDPIPLPVRPVCLGVPPGWCEEQAVAGLDAVVDDPAADAAPISIVVRCTGGACTETQGDGVTIVSRAGRADVEVGWSYNGALPSDGVTP